MSLMNFAGWKITSRKIPLAYKNRIKRGYVTAPFAIFFLKAKRFSNTLNFKNKRSVFLFKTILSIETVSSCHLFQRMARMDMDWNLKSWANFFKF